MSPLPQRKKTQEELAKLREEMGHPSVPAPFSATPAIPATPVTPAPAPRFSPEARQQAAVPIERVEAKPVRSLRRSERNPSPASTPAPSETLPSYRHTREELDLMRRQEAMRVMSSEVPPAVSHLQQITASRWLLALGYLLAFAWGVGGIGVAAYIALKKPRSRHHAGFMAMIAVLVLVFGILYKFTNTATAHAP
jgi:hypothetical protein